MTLSLVFSFTIRIVLGVILALSLTERDATAQAASQQPSSGYMLSHDVTRPYGQYEYIAQSGLYKDVALGDVTEDFRTAFRGIGSVANIFNQQLGWALSPQIGDFSLLVGGGVGSISRPGAEMQWGNDYYGTDPDRLTVLLGPLFLDNFYAGYGAIYSDVNGSVPGWGANLPPDDRWIHIVWVSFRSTMFLGDSICLSLQPYLYWLPNLNRVGWAVPGPLGGMSFMPQLGAINFFQATWTVDVGSWKFRAYDNFSPFAYGLSIFDAFAFGNTSWGDLSPIDRVGRYSVGYGMGGDTANYNTLAGAKRRENQDTELSGFYNMLGFRAFGQHGYSTYSMFYLDRTDVWDKSFNHTYAQILGGAYMKNGDQFFTTYAGYNFITSDPFDTFLNWAVVGAQKTLGLTLRAYTEIGYGWTSGKQEGPEGLIGLIGVQHQFSPVTSQRVEAGRRVFRPVRSAPGIEEYAEYSLIHRLGVRTTIRGIVGISERHLQAPLENDYAIKYAGVVLETALTNRLSATATAGWEWSELEANSFWMERWLYRLNLLYAVSENIQFQSFYQYEDVHGTPNIDYTEHYIYLGITKRF